MTHHASPAPSSPAMAGWNFDNSYARLPAGLFSILDPVPVAKPEMVIFNHALARKLGLNPDLLDSPAGAAMLAGNTLPPGALPLAQAYAGHQFGHFTMLGDGRAILLGEQITPDGQRFDIQLKGSGRTPYSRRGDGRAALGPMLREYIISEALAGLGIPTTRSLAVIATGQAVYRENVQPGAVLVRVAASHVRVGTFQYLAAHGDAEGLRRLTDHVLERHYPDCRRSDNPPLALLTAVMERQVTLIAHWMRVGFIHGVMNTDNMSLCGESIDFGPCAFMDVYDPATVFSSIDHDGRYAFGNQPHIAQWNLTRLAEALLPLLDTNKDKAVAMATTVLDNFTPLFRRRRLETMGHKLGLGNPEDRDSELIQRLLQLMQRHGADYTNTFALLTTGDSVDGNLEASPDFIAWRSQWQGRRDSQPLSPDRSAKLMRAGNPTVIPRNHLVENALDRAVRGDLSVMNDLVRVLAAPYADLPPDSPYRQPPSPGGPQYKTYCGT